MADWIAAGCAVATVLGALWIHSRNDAERLTRVETKVDMIIAWLGPVFRDPAPYDKVHK